MPLLFNQPVYQTDASDFPEYLDQLRTRIAAFAQYIVEILRTDGYALRIQPAHEFNLRPPLRPQIGVQCLNLLLLGKTAPFLHICIQSQLSADVY